MMTNDKLTLMVKKVRLSDDDLKAIVKRVQSSRSIQWWEDDIKQLLYEVKCLKDEAERDGLAADVVAQRGQNARLRAALKPFAEYAATLTNWDSDPVIVARWRGIQVTAGDFRKVAEVLDDPTT